MEITGSSIKRIDTETALPVQMITREDIEKMGATTAAELVKNISANTAPLTDGPSITDGTSGQRGLNGANMRGLGVSSTLVLLNGRRLANFASPGDNAGVDLNNIPAGAIQRVEVLKDGASAIYGTDAIGGVINFITRKDYTGHRPRRLARRHPAGRRRQEARQHQRRLRRPGRPTASTCSACSTCSSSTACARASATSSRSARWRPRCRRRCPATPSRPISTSRAPSAPP